MKPETATKDDMPDNLMSLILRETRCLIEGKCDKKIIIYGVGARGIVLHEALKLLGQKVLYFIDEKAEKDNDMYCCNLPVYEPMKIMYENMNDIFVVVAANLPSEMVDILKGLGLEPETHFGCIFDSSLDNSTFNTQSYDELDFFLGYSRSLDMPGFECLKEEPTFKDGNQRALNILILGGSTTDPEVMDVLEWNDVALRSKNRGSWPRRFHEILNKKEIGNCIFNGGIGGYCSAQELLKFVRDGLTIRPDLVISLNGINDGCSVYWYNDRYPKYHSHFEVIEKNIKPILSDTNPAEPFFRNINYGLETNKSRWQEWFDNQRIMNAICREFDIEYICFLQPYGFHDNGYILSCDVKFRIHWFLHNFFVSKGMAINEHGNTPNFNLKTLLSKYVSDIFSYELSKKEHFSCRYKEMEEFYSNALNLSMNSDFVIPIIDTLYGYPEVLFDMAHCTMKGNTLIAERIYRELTDRGILSKALAKLPAHGEANV